jgi:beta-lactamase class A
MVGKRLRRVCIALSLISLQCVALAQPAPVSVAPLRARPELVQRADALVPLFNGAGDPAMLFTPEFLAQVPTAQVRALSAQITQALGMARKVSMITPTQPEAALLEITFDRGIISARIAIEAQAPFRISGLLITGSSSRESSIDAVIDTVKTLPGQVGFAYARLGSARPVMLKSWQPDRLLGVGSTFKLAILAELIRATNAGERHWADMVTLTGQPLPGGAYTQRAAGTMVSVRELAQAMIASSDNSATDILLTLVTRARVEAMLPILGWSQPARNRPLLSTLELFKLKAGDKGAFVERWLASDEAARRALLNGPIAALPLGAIDGTMFARGAPRQIDTIEWFATPADLIRTMDWIRRNSEGAAGAEARRILSLNSGIGPAGAASWHFVGYKGGSEPGLISMTLLLKSKTGFWYALSVSWNDPAARIDDQRFIGLISRAVALAAAR